MTLKDIREKEGAILKHLEDTVKVPMFKVGDKVTIRRDMVNINSMTVRSRFNYGTNIFMVDRCGKPATIVKLTDDSNGGWIYRIRFDDTDRDDSYVWTEYYFDLYMNEED